MIHKPENVKLVITNNSVEQEVRGFDQSTCSDECSVVSGEQIEWLLQRVQKLKSKSSRCKDTIDWVEVEYGDEYKKPKKGGNMLKHIEGTNGY